MRQLANILTSRENEQLQSLVDPDTISGLRVAISNLEDVVGNSRSNLDDLENAYSRILGIFTRMNEPPPKSRITREDSDNLKIVILKLRGISELHKNLAGVIGSLDEAPTKIVGTLRKIDEAADEKLIKIRRLLAAVSAYDR